MVSKIIAAGLVIYANICEGFVPASSTAFQSLSSTSSRTALAPRNAVAEDTENVLVRSNDGLSLKPAEDIKSDIQKEQNYLKNGFEAPKPLTPVERAGRAVKFWSNVIPILTNYLTLERRMQLEQDINGKELSVKEKEQRWEEAHDWGSQKLADTIQDMKGFYVKTGQMISTRVDMFPMQYCEALQDLQDSVPKIPTDLVKQVIQEELLEGEPLSTLFSEFEEEPLGSASIAQVHKAVLADGRTVAVKVQRPAEEPKLRGDIRNLKAFAKRFRENLPVDYFRVFTELERALENELDFLSEAQSMVKIRAAVSHTADATPAPAALYVPRPIPGLVSKRVLVMEFVEGTPLNKLAEKMDEKGISADSDEAKIFAIRLLESLTEAFARMIFGPGFVHGDPHPGNVFIMEGGNVALIDCGQVKQIPGSMRLKFAQIIQRIALWGQEDGPTVQELADTIRSFGVEVKEGEGDECLAAIALLLFGDTELELPGGYSSQELSSESPLKMLTEFPQELVMMGRATVLIKGIAKKLGVRWNLSERWAENARMSLVCGVEGCSVPVYAMESLEVSGQASGGSGSRIESKQVKYAIKEASRLAKDWAIGKVLQKSPERVRKYLISRAAERASKDL